MYFAQPGDVAVAEEPLVPLPSDCNPPPRRLRVLNRARQCWLVTYFRMETDREKMFYGFIDWKDDVPNLREIRTVEAMNQACATVGFY